MKHLLSVNIWANWSRAGRVAYNMHGILKVLPLGGTKSEEILRKQSETSDKSSKFRGKVALEVRKSFVPCIYEATGITAAGITDDEICHIFG